MSSSKLRGADPIVENHPWLEIRGTASEQLLGVNEVVINMWPDPKLDLASSSSESIGVVIGVKPQLSLAVPMPPGAFSYFWTMALSGQLKHAYCTFTKPRYRSALVRYLSVSNEPEEEMTEAWCEDR